MSLYSVEIVIDNAQGRRIFRVLRDDNMLKVDGRIYFINDPKFNMSKICDLKAGDTVSIIVSFLHNSFVSRPFVIEQKQLIGKSELRVLDIFDESGELYFSNQSFDMMNPILGVIYVYSRVAMSFVVGMCLINKFLENDSALMDILGFTCIIGFISIGALSAFTPNYDITVLGKDFTVPLSSISMGVICSSAIYMLSESKESSLVSIGCSLAYTAAIAVIDNKAIDLACKF